MTAIEREVSKLQRLPVPKLRERYAEAFGEATRTANKAWLVKRIAWRLQALQEGDLSERARKRAEELANDADLRLNPPKPKQAEAAASDPLATTDPRLPPVGSIITRPYKGDVVKVRVLGDGFEYAGETYASLSAVAKAVTGSHCNGFLFFKLTVGAA
ncbi:MAG TPA: DUF2924 domain-containing protein [Gemmataceae bacterium]|jgi:hypothetical protein|nr:DUF2924 domain-containing protein [Gemmataceae bacterium]